MVGADDAVAAVHLRRPAHVQRRAAVRAHVIDGDHLPAGLPEQDHLLAQDLHPDGLVFHIVGQSCVQETSLDNEVRP